MPDFLAQTPIPTLVPVNLSEHSRRALDDAVALSQRVPLALDLLYVNEGHEPSRADVVSALRDALSEDLAARVSIELIDGVPITAILRREAEIGAGLTVIGTHHRGWIRRLVSDSTARQVLHASPCPVWYVPERSRGLA